MTKVVLIPNCTIGNTVINYMADFYHTDYTLVGGVAAVNGYHECPKLGIRVAKHPYRSEILAPEAVAYLQNNKDYSVEIIE